MTLNYQTIGQGPPLLILHGLFGSLDNWMTIARELSGANTVLLVDLRNHGGSFHDALFNYPSMAEDVNELVSDIGIQDFSIIGHSMGGKVAMFFAAGHQEQIRKLIIVDIGPKYYPVHHQTILEGLSSLDLLNITSRTQADQQLANYVTELGVRQFLLKNLKRSSNGGFEWKMNLPAIKEQIEQVGKPLDPETKIHVPSLFIRGSESDYIKDMDFSSIIEQFPNAAITTVPNAGHWVHAEAPQAFLNEVRSFLNHQ